MVLASMTEVIVTAAFGLVGTVIGAMIAGAVAVALRRADKDERVQNAAVEFVKALEELREKPSAGTVRAADYAFRRLSISAETARVEKDFASGSFRLARDF